MSLHVPGNGLLTSLLDAHKFGLRMRMGSVWGGRVGCNQLIRMFYLLVRAKLLVEFMARDRDGLTAHDNQTASTKSWNLHSYIYYFGLNTRSNQFLVEAHVLSARRPRPVL